jgi:copper resistance protein B
MKRLVIALWLASASPAAAQTQMPLPDKSAQAQPEAEIGTTPAPAAPEDHAADALFDPAEMAQARARLRHENGGLPISRVTLDLAEYHLRKGKGGYRWEGEAWYGGDIHRLLFKYEGEGQARGALEDTEFQLLYARAVSPFWNVHVGLRHDLKPDPSRTYAVLGIEGVAPYWLDLAATLFVSDAGELLARAEGHYDQRITQSLILQPRFEANLAAQAVTDHGLGAGLSTFELGVRLRYEIKREFAPYVGVEWATKIGATARSARKAGEDPAAINFVVGIRAWF